MIEYRELKGQLNIPVIYPELQEKSVVITQDITVITPDSDYYGLSKVTVNAENIGGYRLNIENNTLVFSKGASVVESELDL